MSNEKFSLPANDQHGDDQAWLADVLQRAASAAQPAFSEQLHARIMNAIRSGQPPRTLAAVCTTAAEGGSNADSIRLATPAVAAASSASRPKRRVAASWLAAAAALLLLAGGAWRLSSLGPSGGSTVNPPTVDKGQTYTWADLDHDAKMSSQLVADQAPFEAPVEELALSSSK